VQTHDEDRVGRVGAEARSRSKEIGCEHFCAAGRKASEANAIVERFGASQSRAQQEAVERRTVFALSLQGSTERKAEVGAIPRRQFRIVCGPLHGGDVIGRERFAEIGERKPAAAQT